MDVALSHPCFSPSLSLSQINTRILGSGLKIKRYRRVASPPPPTPSWPLWSTPFPPPAPSSPHLRSVRETSSAFSRMSSKWNDPECNPLGLFSFTCHNAFDAGAAAGVNSLLLRWLRGGPGLGHTAAASSGPCGRMSGPVQVLAAVPVAAVSFVLRLVFLPLSPHSRPMHIGKGFWVVQ